MGSPGRGVAVVTGASAGVGRAIVRALAEAGYDIGLIARGADGLAAAAKEVEACGGSGPGGVADGRGLEAGGRRAHAVRADVADHRAVEAAADAIEEALGPITLWVNDAMVSVFAPFTDIEPDEFERVTAVTYHGYVNGTRAALRRMLPRDRGVIVQVGSALSYRGIPAQSAYCGAKHAVNGFTESVRCELLHRHSAVQIGIVQLPAVNTPQFDWVLSRLPGRPQPVPPIYQPELIASAVVAMAERPRREMWLTERAILTILGNRLAPGYLDRRLGHSGIESQQTDEPADPDRPANLWDPLPGDHGAHGAFDGRAIDHNPFVWLSLHRPPLVSALLNRLARLR